MPDKELLARWLEDELEPAEQAQVEPWCAGRHEWLAWREETRAWKRLLQRALPAEVEPPAGEFFDARIARMVRADGDGDAVVAARGGRAAGRQPAGTVRRPAVWSAWWMPLGAAAGMGLCFWAGARLGGSAAGNSPRPAATAVYTPERGVQARVFTEGEAEAVVIVLDGVAAIPDSFEVPDRAARRDEPAPASMSQTDRPR